MKPIKNTMEPIKTDVYTSTSKVKVNCTFNKNPDNLSALKSWNKNWSKYSDVLSKIKGEVMRNKTYKFIISNDGMLDLIKISQELSSMRSVAVVYTSSSMPNFILVHPSLMRKAELLDIPHKFMSDILYNNFCAFIVFNTKEIDAVLKWVRKVHKTSWGSRRSEEHTSELQSH